MQGKALRLLIFNTSAVERQRFERNAIRPYPPVAPWEVAQPGLPVKGAEHRRAAAALPLTGSPGCAMGGAATGDTSSRASVDEAGKMGGSLLVTVSRRYTKTPLRFSGSGALRKVDSPLNCCAFVCSC